MNRWLCFLHNLSLPKSVFVASLHKFMFAVLQISAISVILPQMQAKAFQNCA